MQKNRKKHIAGAVAAMPIFAAAVLCLCYAARPLGYLPQEVINPEYLKAEMVNVDALKSVLPESLEIYRQVYRGKSDVDENVRRIYGALGEIISDNDKDTYDSCMVYRGDASNYIWYYYDGAFKLYFPNKMPAMPYPELELTERCLALLCDMGCPLPAPSSIDERNHILCYDFEPLENKVCDGTVDFGFEYGEDELRLYEIEYEIIELESLGNYIPADTGQIAQKLKDGHFSLRGMPTPGSVREIICNNFELDYMADSKGFYRPVYIISCFVDGEATELTVAV